MSEAILVTADFVVLYPSIPREADFAKLNERGSPKVPTGDIVRMTDLPLKIFFLFERGGRTARVESNYWHKICTFLCFCLHE